MNQEKIEDLLDRYLNKVTSLEENELVEKWLQDHRNTHSSWDEMDQASKNLWLSKKLNEINHTIDRDAIVHKPETTRKFWGIIVGAAASIILAFILYSQLPLLKHSWKTEELLVQVTSKGQKRLIVLPDGSRVWVNQNSTFKYPKEFNERSREVYLSGEAYFDVTHDSEKTFIIHNGSFTTTVLGTAFNIREDKVKHTIEVTVSRGKVSVANSGKPLAFITPSQQVSYNLSKQELSKTIVDANEASSWKQTDLQFEDVTFGEAIAQLSMHFGVGVNFSNEKLKACRFSGANLADQGLEDILKVMCAFNNARYIKNRDGSFVISGEGCN
jgi:transmembrane sensor